MAPPPEPRPSAGQQAANFAVFAVKMLGMLAAIFAFGFLVFWLRRHLH